MALLAFGAGLLLESGGHVRVTLAGLELTIGPIQAVVLAVLLVGSVWIALRALGFLAAIWRFVNGDETAISRYFDRSRERRGFEALADGMMALASGEGRVAMAKAARAEKFLRRPALTNLLAAQAAEMAGDRSGAEEIYKRLLQDDRTRFVGVRGIMKQKLEAGDLDTALSLAERAFTLKPRHEETANTLLNLQTKKGDWSGARRTLGAKLKAGALPRDVHRRRDAIMALSESSESDDYDTKVLEANRLSPELVPAAVAAAHVHIDKESPRQAVRVIRKAWDKAPHPELAEAFAAIEPEETPEARLKRFTPLIKRHPDHPEVRQLLAELNIAAGDFSAARSALGDLTEEAPTARTLALIAAIERAQGGEDTVVRAYLARALSAPRDAIWICDNCQSQHGTWAPVCSNCDAIDTFDWRPPPAEQDAAASTADMLPLLVDVVESDTEQEEVSEQIDVSEGSEAPAENQSDDAELTDAETVQEPEKIPS